MKKQHKIGLSGFIIFVILTACDSFILPPALNLNPDDPNQGFGRLESALIDKGKVRVIWDWYDLERKVRGVAPVYDEVIIKHNRGSYPASRLGGESFEIKDWNPATNPMWAATFSDLKDDREHFFALYAHEKDGRWVGPMYTSTYLEGFEYDVISGLNPISSISVVATPPPPPPPEPPYPAASTIDPLTDYPLTISKNQAMIYYYDNIGFDENIVSAKLTINISLAPISADSLQIYPMRAYVEETSGTLSDHISLYGFTVDRSLKIEYPLTSTDTGTKIIDISSVFSKAQYHRHNGIYLQMAGLYSVDIATPEPFLELEIARNW